MSDKIPSLAIVPAKKARLDRTLWNACIFCQRTHTPMLQATPIGAEKVKSAHESRIQFGDISSKDTLDRLTPNIEHLLKMNAKWHKSCYATFTGKQQLQRVEARQKTQEMPLLKAAASTSHTTPLTRTTVPRVDWKLCIFCQSRTRQDLHQVMSYSVSNSILNVAQTDYKLKCRIGENDLIAFEALYHKSCKLKAERNRPKEDADAESLQTDVFSAAFELLIQELDIGFKNGNVYNMRDVLQRYCKLLENIGMHEPSYRSFKLKQKLQKHYGPAVQFRQQRDRTQPLLIFPTVSTGEAIEALTLTTEASSSLCDDVEDELVSGFQEQQMFLQSLHYVCAKIKADLMSTKGIDTYDDINTNAAEKCVPDSLYMLLKWLYDDSNANQFVDDELELSADKDIHKRILNTGATILFHTRKSKIVTPKHMATAMLVHHSTRSRKLVDYLYSSGDSVSYDTLRKIDTTIATDQLARFEENGNVVIPRTLVADRFVQFSADNLDIIEETLDGKGTFHVTQMAAFQRGPPQQLNREASTIGNAKSLKSIPTELNQLQTAKIGPQRPSPKFAHHEHSEVMQCDTSVPARARLLDKIWLCARNNSDEKQNVPSWTPFNQKISDRDHPQSIVGYLPLIPAPAHDMDTIATVLVRCQAIAKHLGQSKVVVTFDEALYCKAKELMWHNPDQFRNVVVRLGGFHVALNFLKTIGQHFKHSGLSEVLHESGVYTELTANKILEGKSWNRAVRAHKLMLESLWRILWSVYEAWRLENVPHDLSDLQPSLKLLRDAFAENDETQIKEIVDQTIPKMESALNDFREFFDVNSENATFKFWNEYLELASILLCFVRAERDGNWPLHLEMFKEMLPLMAVYDHSNYTRWGTVYLLDMQQLSETAPTVYAEFMDGNFVVKHTPQKFNNVSTDQALEFVNKMCKVSGGLVGITRTESAMNRWLLTCSERARIADEARAMAGMVTHVSTMHKEASSARSKRDENDIQKLTHQLVAFNPFGRKHDDLLCISTNDVAPDDVKNELLTARERGKSLIQELISKRLGPNASVDFFEPIKKNNSKTFEAISSELSKQSCAPKVLKADRKIYHRLLSAASSGREINLPNILKHELSPVPQSLASLDGQLHPTNKASLGHIIGDQFAKTELSQTTDKTCTLVDAMGIVQALQKPKGAQTFGDYADTFAENIFGHFRDGCTRVDVVFDAYKANSIKTTTRQNRSGKTRKVRRIIDSRSVILPYSWPSFLALEENKKNLIQFLSTELLQRANSLPTGSELVIAGGPQSDEHAASSVQRDVCHLMSTQEEADTRLILHAYDAKQQGFEKIVIISRDTDVLVLAIHHNLGSNIWISCGTSKQPKFLPVHEIRNNMQGDVVSALPLYHAVTGCDSTSQFYGLGKKSTWSVLIKHPHLLSGLFTGRINEFISTTNISLVEQYIMLLYSKSAEQHQSINSLRAQLFHTTDNPSKLPPTSDAMKLHILRAMYQALVWYCAGIAKPDLPSPETCGWHVDKGHLVPTLMELEAIPSVCRELVSCGCHGDCSTARCSCKRASVACIEACKCNNCKNGVNRSEETDSDSEEDEIE